VAVLAACSSLKEGRIVAMHYDAAHDEQEMYQQYIGEDCTTTASDVRVCHPTYIWAWRTHHYSDRWWITIQGTNPDSGKLEQRDLDVSEARYAHLEVGQWFIVPSQ
jgi:hypothetical protein